MRASLNVKMFRDAMGPSSGEFFKALQQGIRASGDKCEYTSNDWEPCDVAVQASGVKMKPGGVEKPHNRVRRILKQCKPKGRLVLESPVFRRGAEHGQEYKRLSWDGFMRDDGIFCNENSPPDRWERIMVDQKIEVKPWRSIEDGYILLCLQKRSDASLRGLQMEDWLESTVSEIRRFSQRNIVIRPHPLDRRFPEQTAPGIIWSTNPSFTFDVAGAWACVTYSSLSAIESACDGVPTFCLDEGNHAWPMRAGTLAFLENSPFHCRPDRTQWLQDLAYTQWTLKEFKEGIPWRRLRPYYFPESTAAHSEAASGR